MSRPITPLDSMAGTTGLEPAASAVTGQRSNQLNYVPTCTTGAEAPVASEIIVTASLRTRKWRCGFGEREGLESATTDKV